MLDTPPEDSRRAKTCQAGALYAAMIVATVAAFVIIRNFGESQPGRPAPAADSRGAAQPTGGNQLLPHVLIGLAAVVVAGRVVGGVFQYLGQPPVIGEVIAGILLGPSCLGRISPAAAAWVLPEAIVPIMGVLAQLGVILYMFVVGLELDIGLLRQQGRAIVAISHASITAPFLLGALLALGVAPTLAGPHGQFTVFALFLGVAMSITAFPVLARILTDLGLSRTPLGVAALTCAATDDVTAWCLLALVVGVAKSQIGASFTVIVLTLVYIAAMFLVVRPMLLRLTPRADDSPPTRGMFAALLVGLLISSLATEWIGVHAIFGAFVLGAVIPHDSPVAKSLIERVEDVASVLFLPAFFAFTGMRTQIGLISSAGGWLLCGAIIAVATTGKFGGTLAAARCTGFSWRDAAQLGVLMNTRGLMELIVLNIGLDLEVISPTLFAMMVVMAIVTTTATTPVLKLLTPKRQAATH